MSGANHVSVYITLLQDHFYLQLCTVMVIANLVGGGGGGGLELCCDGYSKCKIWLGPEGGGGGAIALLATGPVCR